MVQLHGPIAWSYCIVQVHGTSAWSNCILVLLRGPMHGPIAWSYSVVQIHGPSAWSNCMVLLRLCPIPWVAAKARWLPRPLKLQGLLTAVESAPIYAYAQGSQGVLPLTVKGATSQLDLLSLTPLFVAGCDRRQLGVPHLATSVDYCK